MDELNPDAPLAAVSVNDGTKGTLSIGFMCTVCIVTRGEANGRLIIDESEAAAVMDALDSLGTSREPVPKEEPQAVLAGDLINCSNNEKQW